MPNALKVVENLSQRRQTKRSVGTQMTAQDFDLLSAIVVEAIVL